MDNERNSLSECCDYPIIKILILGDHAVGKTSLMLRFINDHFSENHLNTLGIDFKAKNIKHKEHDFQLQIWDSAGQERFKNITRTYYRRSSAIIIAFDSTSVKSFENVQNWIADISTEVDNKVPLAIAATKCDIECPENVIKGKNLAKEIRLKYFKTSSKIDKNIQELFWYLIRESIRLKTIDYGSIHSLMLRSDTIKSKKHKCCN
ncbi:hypothetical protein SteCoe_36903 [Stentor coeruleus]|uniref:Uncharacterized protein n=1 Tax=Stentor coeruleus TaxID=5963 RepID=A0A1R2AP83_9CILI|nr:hypothetical protein SteCoe_36903 [Stentor coeruleus]